MSISKPKFKVNDIVELKREFSHIDDIKQFKIVGIYAPPYRGSNQYGYKLQWIRRNAVNEFWEYWGHKTVKGLERFYYIP